jgi:transcription elongation factor Elf1
MKRRKSKRRRQGPRLDEGSYVCPSCGEAIVIPLDLSAGDEQQYVEDCPVCCNPNVIHVELFQDGDPPRVWAEAE